MAATIFPPLHAYEVKFTIENVSHAITFRPFLVAAHPKKRGTHVFYLPAYDAGTEINDEVPSIGSPLDCFTGQSGYPVDPLGNTGVGGTGVMDFQANDRVHIHRGNLGDADLTGGISDLDSRVHRWLNPVVKLTIVVKPWKNKHGDDGDDD